MATAQTLSGTGALRLGAEFMKKFAQGKTVYISNPTWGTHNSIMTQAPLERPHTTTLPARTRLRCRHTHFLTVGGGLPGLRGFFSCFYRALLITIH